MLEVSIRGSDMYGVMYYQDGRWCDVQFFNNLQEAFQAKTDGVEDGYECTIRRGF